MQNKTLNALYWGLGIVLIGIVYMWFRGLMGLYLSLVTYVLLAVVKIDLETLSISNKSNLLVALVSLCSIWVIPQQTVYSSVVGGVVGFVFFLVTGYVGRSLGGGDVKLMGAVGFLLGFKRVLLAMVIALICGSLVGFYLQYKANRTKYNEPIPFGPFIGIGVYLALLLPV